ncbi:MAG: Sec-independent protein translocase protein TatB, partial [Actinomycetes bacterium]
MDVGWGELLLLAVVALFIFGPDKLPKAAADAGRLVRRLKEMATKAQSEMSNHGVDIDGIKNDLRSVADLHPRRILGSAMSNITDSGTPTITPSASTTNAPHPGAATTTDPESITPAPGGP